MFLGHAAVAFALAVLVANWRGWPTHRALALGVATGAFAAIPDVDVLYAVFAMDASALLEGTQVRPSEFWGTAHGVHRSMTHSLAVAAIAAPAFGLWAASNRTWRPAGEDSDAADGRAVADGGDAAGVLVAWDSTTSSGPTLPGAVVRGRRALGLRAVAVAGILALLAAATVVSGVLGLLVMGAFLLSGVLVATFSRRWLGLSPLAIVTAAAAGLGSHPWGDMFTGQPPQLLYPVDFSLVHGRVMLSADPTLHLLAAFAIELGAVALAVIVLARQLGYRPRALVGRRATLGAGYGVAAILLVPPTVDFSYQFVFSILAVGLICGGVRRTHVADWSLEALQWRLLGDLEATFRTIHTGMAGVAVALVSYTVVYLALAVPLIG